MKTRLTSDASPQLLARIIGLLYLFAIAAGIIAPLAELPRKALPQLLRPIFWLTKTCFNLGLLFTLLK